MIDIPVYISFSREDPHYADFYKLYCKDHYFRSYFNRTVLQLGQLEESQKFWFKWTIARLFDTKYKLILDMDIQGLYNQIYEDYRPVS